MQFKRIYTATLVAIGLSLSAATASSEEPTVATFVPPQHHTNTVMKKTTDKKYKLLEVNSDERALMDAAVADGLKVIFADYAERGIDNAEAIYNAINK